MKRILITALLALTVSKSFSQGHVYFDNYYTFGSVGAPIYLAGGSASAGPYAPLGYKVDLHYAIGAVTNPNASDPLARPIGTLVLTSEIGSGATAGQPGFFDAGTVVIPNYVSGPITFEMTCYGPGYYGHSQTITVGSLPSSGIGLELNFPSFAIHPIPEPSTLSLIGSGVAIWIALRNRRNRDASKVKQAESEPPEASRRD